MQKQVGLSRYLRKNRWAPGSRNFRTHLGPLPFFNGNGTAPPNLLVWSERYLPKRGDFRHFVRQNVELLRYYKDLPAGLANLLWNFNLYILQTINKTSNRLKIVIALIFRNLSSMAIYFINLEYDTFSSKTAEYYF